MFDKKSDLMEHSVCRDVDNFFKKLEQNTSITEVKISLFHGRMHDHKHPLYQKQSHEFLEQLSKFFNALFLGHFYWNSQKSKQSNI